MKIITEIINVTIEAIKVLMVSLIKTEPNNFNSYHNFDNYYEIMISRYIISGCFRQDYSKYLELYMKTKISNPIEEIVKIMKIEMKENNFHYEDIILDNETPTYQHILKTMNKEKALAEFSKMIENKFRNTIKTKILMEI